jgi:aryl-alcohol dehydrogenase-like predicted oxidoreductase
MRVGGAFQVTATMCNSLKEIMSIHDWVGASVPSCETGHLHPDAAQTGERRSWMMAAMDYRSLGRSGCAVSSLTLGTMTFGAETDEAGAHAQLDSFMAAGGNLVDTADVYSAGVSEQIIGTWLAQRPAEVRDRVVLATKGRFGMGTDVNDVGTSRRHLRRALDASLRRLGVDEVDLYQVHAWDPVTPLEETLSTLDAMVRAGRIRYYGLSNFTGWQVQKAVALAGAEGWAPPVTLQPQYNLLVRELEWEIIPSCLDAGLGLLPWSPLGGGWLTGKYARDERPQGATRLGEDPDRGVEAYDRRSRSERTWDVVDAVRKIAEGRGTSMAQVALAWLRDRPAVTSVILGARTTEQLEDNLGSTDLRLSSEETAILDKASDPQPADYPYGGPGVEQRSRELS